MLYRVLVFVLLISMSPARATDFFVVTSPAGVKIKDGYAEYLTGGEYQFTLPSASSVPGGTTIIFINSDGYPKYINNVISASPYILWPMQQVVVQSLNGVWLTTPDHARFTVNCGSPIYGPIICSPSEGLGVQLHVDQTSGNASDGWACVTAAFPCKTINGAKAVEYQDLDFGGTGYPVLNIMPGTYAESVNFQGALTGAAVQFIRGPQGGVIWTPGEGNNNSFEASDGAIIEFGLVNGPGSGITLDGGGTSGGIAMLVHQTIVDVNGITFGNWNNGVHMYVDNNAALHLNQGYVIAGSATFHLQLGLNSTFEQDGNSIVSFQNIPSFYALYWTNGGRISIDPNTAYAGAANIGNACVVYAGEASLNGNVLPGNNSCTQSTATSFGGNVIR